MLQNLKWYWKVVREDYDGDWEPLLMLLRRKMEKMIDAGYPSIEDGPRYVRQIQVCVWLIDRILADDYGFTDYCLKCEPWRVGNEIIGSHMDYMIDQDVALLFNMMRKHLRTWWD